MAGSGHLVRGNRCCLLEGEEGEEFVIAWVYAQPCVGSDAESGWSKGCYPYFDICYMQEVTRDESVIPTGTKTVTFAFLGTCWFLDGTEEAIEDDDLNENLNRPALGFGISTIENGDGVVYEDIGEITAASQCLGTSGTAHDDEYNEKWMKFLPCDSNDLVICLEGTEFECAQFEDYGDTTIYIPLRFMQGLGETGNSCDNVNGNWRDESPTGFADAFDDECFRQSRCRTIHDYRSYIADRNAEPEDICSCHSGCCYKSCTEEDEAEIITSMPTPCVGDVCCCDIWTPKWKHRIDGGEIDCAENYGVTPVLGGENHSGDPPREWTGCCSCVYADQQEGDDLQLCRVFTGMTNFSITFALRPHNVHPYGYPEEPPLSSHKYYACGVPSANVTLNFTVHPEDADTGYHHYDPNLNMYHCILLNETSNDVCVDPDGTPDDMCNPSGYTCQDAYNDGGCYSGTWCKTIGTATGSGCVAGCDGGGYDICDPCDWCVGDCGAPCKGESCVCGSGSPVVLRSKCKCACNGASQCGIFGGFCNQFCWHWLNPCKDTGTGNTMGAVLQFVIQPYVGATVCHQTCCSGECGSGDGAQCNACAVGACQGQARSVCVTNKNTPHCETEGEYNWFVLCLPLPDQNGVDGECLGA